MAIREWSKTAASNGSGVTGINWAEGQDPSTVNNSAREMMAQVAEWRDDIAALTTGGAGDGYTLTTNVGYSAYAEPMWFIMRVDRANTGAATLNVDAIGAKNLQKFGGTALAANDLTANTIVLVSYHASGDRFEIAEPAGFKTLKDLVDTINTAGFVDTSGTPVANDFARFTDADTVEGRSYAEVRADLSLEVGTDVLAQQTIGIADGNLVEIDSASVADDEYARFTANGLESRSTAEVLSDIGAMSLSTENQTLSGGVEVTEKNLGTQSSGTLTMDVGDRPVQYYTNGGAHTLAPGTVGGSCLLLITNDASAGAITTSGFTFVDGDDFSTTNGDDFLCQVSVVNSFSVLTVKALQ